MSNSISTAVQPALHDTEPTRLKELYKYSILSTPFEEDFDELVHLVSKTLHAPVAVISMVDVNRQWFKAKVGLDSCETSRKCSLCAHTIAQDGLLEIEDLSLEDKFSSLPLLTQEPHVRFYAGMPLVTRHGYKIGTLCIYDINPRKLDEGQKSILTMFAKQTIRLMELRIKNDELNNLTEAQKRITCILSHDIRNPLESFRMMLDIYDEEQVAAGNTPSSAMNDLLKQQMDNTLSLLSNIVQWGKLQLSGERMGIHTADIQHEVTIAIEGINVAALLKGNNIKNLVPDNISTAIDSQGLQFVLRNLLSNANKFTENGDIKVLHEQVGNLKFLKITDNGAGMSQERVADLNSNKNTAHSNGTQNEKGNGLGLGLIHEFLSKHNSNLTFESEIGKGTTVKFFI